MLEGIKNEVSSLLSNDNSGHSMDHVNRVLNLSIKFAEKENANIELVSLIALLHDVDDYKLFGKYSQDNLINAKMIMTKAMLNEEIQQTVCEQLKCIGYSKRLKGMVPSTLEGKIVSDADMCDGLGAHGILRTYAYNTKKGAPFFDKNIYPDENLTSEQYVNKGVSTSVCHIFEKILKLKDLMLTNSGKEEAKNRHKIVVEFLYHFFDEEIVPEWTNYLNNYLKLRK